MDFLDNDNIEVYKDKNNKVNINIIPYDIVLIENPEFVKKMFNKIVKHKQDILDQFNTDVFVISISGYSIDGLYESNSLLIDDNSQLCCIY